MRLFHYHLLTSQVREHERRYTDELGFRLVARYGTIAGESVAAGPERAWRELDDAGFRHRLTRLDRDGVEVVVQPGRWEPPRVDHVGVLVARDEYERVLVRAAAAGLRVRDSAGRRTFVATGVGYRLELRIDPDVRVAPFEVVLATDEPAAKAAALAALLGLAAEDDAVRVSDGIVRLVAGGAPGRPTFVRERVGDAA